MELVEVLKTAVLAGASDIHLVIGKPPMMRLNGEIAEIPGFPKINADESKRLVYSILYEEQRAKFEENWELDCSFSVTGLSRFRVNVLLQKNGVEAVMRVISSKIPTPEQLRLSTAVTNLSDLDRGLVLVTGPTGSGKSTTWPDHGAHHQKMTGQSSRRGPHRIRLRIQEEHLPPARGRAKHQELQRRPQSALRQDPDVGELRDLETIALAITAAETGHLCFGTLHTHDAPSTIDRIIDVFPPHQQSQIRVQLAVVLQAVVSQILVPRKDGDGRVAAREIMIMTPAISNLIREGKTHMIYGAIDTGAKFGMVPMDKSLAEMVRMGLISTEEGLLRAHNPEGFKILAGISGRTSSASSM